MSADIMYVGVGTGMQRNQMLRAVLYIRRRLRRLIRNGGESELSRLQSPVRGKLFKRRKS